MARDPKEAASKRSICVPEEHVAKVWNMAYYSGLVCIAPYMNVYYKRLHISERQIGILAALSPWVNASSGAAWAAFADYTRWHKPLLILTSVLALMSRISTAFVSTFAMVCLVALLSETFTAPVSILSDIAIMSAAKTDGHYGEQRMFASAGWGIFSALSGFLVSKYSIYTAFQLYFALAAFAIIPVCFLKFHAKPHFQQNQEAHHEVTDAAAAPASEAEDRYQPVLNGDCDAALPVSSVTGRSPVPAQAASKSAVSAILSRTPQTASPHAHHNMQEGSSLSPWASLDLSLHPDDNQMCVVRITADPERELLPHSSTQDRLIEDPTAVAVLEHAFQPNNTHPVFHVHMPSRRSSLHGHETASDCDSDADHTLQPGSSQVHAHHALSQPLLQTEQEEQAMGLWLRWRRLLANPQAVPFFAMSLLMGYGTGILSVYLFLYLDELGGSEMLMGLCITVTCIVELPIFAANNWILKKLGVNSVIHITLAVCVIRMAAYSTMHMWNSLWWVLAVESINGITFACFWPAGTLHCTKIAPPGMAATVQGVFTSLYGGVGGGLGGLFGGFVYSIYGAAAVFQIGLLVIVAGWIACTICQLVAGCVCTPTT
ncbi:TPA: hypothetical protein ACH3X2_002234 [Trebouxia sp. C0005]